MWDFARKNENDISFEKIVIYLKKIIKKIKLIIIYKINNIKNESTVK